MKIIDGKGAILGRVASYAAKEALKGEEIKIVNCGDLIISGNKEFTENKLRERRKRVGVTQTGPKIPGTTEKIVKRVIRGMVPNYRLGRGKEALKRIMCYNGVPKEYVGKDMIEIAKGFKGKGITVRSVSK